MNAHPEPTTIAAPNTIPFACFTCHLQAASAERRSPQRCLCSCCALPSHLRSRLKGLHHRAGELGLLHLFGVLRLDEQGSLGTGPCSSHSQGCHGGPPNHSLHVCSSCYFSTSETPSQAAVGGDARN